jgi:hypothetical protein
MFVSTPISDVLRDTQEAISKQKLELCQKNPLSSGTRSTLTVSSGWEKAQRLFAKRALILSLYFGVNHHHINSPVHSSRNYLKRLGPFDKRIGFSSGSDLGQEDHFSNLVAFSNNTDYELFVQFFLNILSIF